MVRGNRRTTYTQVWMYVGKSKCKFSNQLFPQCFSPCPVPTVTIHTIFLQYLIEDIRYDDIFTLHVSSLNSSRMQEYARVATASLFKRLPVSIFENLLFEVAVFACFHESSHVTYNIESKSSLSLFA